jgi:RNA-directed DNA polymerase
VRRIGQLLEQAASFENLLRSFYLARQGCGATPAVCRFFFQLEPELLRLQHELHSGAYQPGAYHYFPIHDPKERVIAVAPFRDRVVHHAIIQVLTPIYERVFIFDSYATRPGKGTHVAIRRAQSFLRRRWWYWKTDIAKYFESVDHDILLSLLWRKIKDHKLLVLLERIIRNTPVSGKGLPIGNLTSQFLANVYLDPLDHFIKEHLRVKGYVRYMDDLVLFEQMKHVLLLHWSVIAEFLDRHLKLRINEPATFLNRSAHGLSFLGMRIFPRFIRVKPENRRRSLRRLTRRIEDWQQGYLDEATMQQSMTSIIGHLRYFCPRMRIEAGADAI